MTRASREEVLEQLADARDRLASLDRERELARAKVEALAAELDALPASGPRPEAAPAAHDTAARTPRTNGEKVALFRELFRGRTDVYPTRFVSKKTGKPGYAPACANKFVRGLCDLPRVKCGECTNQAFIPADDQAVLGHLQGRHVMGVYPMLRDETCWFLAVDFDGPSWPEDAGAFAETCRAAAVPCALERSRSGNGAHAWLFLAAPVPASVARQMGSYLLTETMSRRHQLGMRSYDRLFPNQDTMPRGGFGNLIALPLQKEARAAGNTIFLDERLEPIADQWAYLASVPRQSPGSVTALAGDATRRGLVLGVRCAEVEDEVAPWTRLPSGRAAGAAVAGPLPAEIKAVLAQRLYVERTGLGSPLVNQIKRLAAFQNPEFYKKQKMRLSTATTPRVIALAEEAGEHVALPRGCQPQLVTMLARLGVRLLIEDQRHEGEPIDVHFHGELTAVQRDAARALLAQDTGVLVAPPGVGKTVLGTYLIAERRRSTLVLVHRTPLLDQWTAQLAMFLGMEAKEIGCIGGGKKKPTGRVDVAMIQSLVRQGRVDDLVAGYGQVIVDECHHVPAVSFERVMSEVRARYVVGLTATPQRRDGHDPILEMQLGPVRHTVDARGQAACRPFDHRLIARTTGFRLDGDPAASIQEVYRQLAGDDARNRLILDDVIAAIEDGRSPILLTERKDHLELLTDKLRAFVRHLVVLQGGMTARERREVTARLLAIPDDEERLVLATGRYVGEGFDDARLDTLFLAMPISWKGTLVQYAGRLHRLHPRKTEVRIFDYVDREVPMLERMFGKRLRGYRAIGYARGEAPLGHVEEQEAVIEYDAEAVRHDDDGFG